MSLLMRVWYNLCQFPLFKINTLNDIDPMCFGHLLNRYRVPTKSKMLIERSKKELPVDKDLCKKLCWRWIHFWTTVWYIFLSTFTFFSFLSWGFSSVFFKLSKLYFLPHFQRSKFFSRLLSTCLLKNLIS